MRVLLLGPVDTVHVIDQATALAEHGMDVIVAGERWGAQADADGLRVVVKDGPFIPWLSALLREVRPDIVHAHWMPFAAKALAARARPLVAQPWGSDVYRASLPFRAANVPVARFADLIVADSRDLADALVRLGAKPEHTAVVNWGVDLSLFTPAPEGRVAVRRRLGLEAGPLVLSPRLLKPLYNPQTILAAFEQVRERVPGAQLVLKHPSRQLPPELGGPREGVHVVGHVPYERMAEWYRAADVCVSIPDTDSSPRSVWEAMACATTVVITDLPWAREVMRPGEDALLVEPQVSCVANALTAVLTDTALASRLGENGRALAVRVRDRQVETNRLIALYRQLAGRS